ncbi:hypothetical protein TPChic_0328a [Treponema pallidum subsp. pallidum str. Chicago]|nr:hypothetical protein TPChic_0328a [Treponema pallidum subsp. pallidum str. Chicago]
MFPCYARRVSGMRRAAFCPFFALETERTIFCLPEERKT